MATKIRRKYNVFFITLTDNASCCETINILTCKKVKIMQLYPFFTALICGIAKKVFIHRCSVIYKCYIGTY